MLLLFDGYSITLCCYTIGCRLLVAGCFEFWFGLGLCDWCFCVGLVLDWWVLLGWCFRLGVLVIDFLCVFDLRHFVSYEFLCGLIVCDSFVFFWGIDCFVAFIIRCAILVCLGLLGDFLF